MFDVQKIADTANRFLGTLLPGAQEHEHSETKQEGPNTIGNHAAAIDLTKDDDEQSKINPPTLQGTHPLRRAAKLYQPPSGPRHEIHDPYPEPTMTAKVVDSLPMSRVRKPDRRDEQRTRGESRLPKDVQIIVPPGSESAGARPPTAIVARSKPDASRSFRPRNSLNGNAPYQGTAGATRACAATGYVRGGGLATATSRGGNVKAAERNFSDDQHQAKRRKTAHVSAGGETASFEQKVPISVESDSETEAREVARRLAPVKAAKKHDATSGSIAQPSWEVSGVREFREVEKRMERPKDRGLQVQSNGSTTWKSASPARTREVIQDVSHNKVVVLGAGSPVEAQPKRAGEEQAIGMARHAPRRSRGRPGYLSPYFNTQETAKSGNVKGAEAIDVDVTEQQPPSLVSSVFAILGSGKDATNRSFDEEQARTTAPPIREAHLDNYVSSSSGEDDELSRETPTVSNGSKSKAAHTVRPPTKANTSRSKKDTWTVEKAVDTAGKEHTGFDFLELAIEIGLTAKFIRLRNPNAGNSADSLCVVDTRKIRDILFSDDADEPILRIREAGTGQSFFDIKFHDKEIMLDFIHGLKNVTSMKNILPRTGGFMSRIYGKRLDHHRKTDSPIDDGAEEALLEQRVVHALEQAQGEARKISEGGRQSRGTTLLSQMRSSNTDGGDTEKATSTRPVQKRIKPKKEAKPEDDVPFSLSRPVRNSRGRKVRSPTPLDLTPFKRYSKDPGLGPPWDQPIIYPETGRKRVTVNFTDLERLDEGEFLNDNLIEFYSRWLQVNRPIKEKTAYFFGTHFYTTVSETPKMEKGNKTSRSNVNYKAVQRWTAKDDIFDFDFVIVPINESAHWYLAIICNLPNVQRKFADDEVEVAEEASHPDSLTDAQGSKSQPVEISGLPEAISPITRAGARPVAIPDSTELEGESGGALVRQDAETEATEVIPTRGMSNNLRLTSPKPAKASDLEGTSEIIWPKKEADPATCVEEHTQSQAADDMDLDLPDSQAAQGKSSQASTGVLANATLSSPGKRKGKRKSVPRGCNPDQPAIVIIDPMGIGHPRAITVLKDYLIEEARSKRGMEIDRAMFKGINTKEGIPKQDNYYDCGIFILGYLDKFMSDPEDFGKKLLAQSFELSVDWPEMKSNNMRDTMRELLQQIAKDQRELRQARKQEKRAAKRQTAPAASSPPGRSSGNPVDLSSPSQPHGKDGEARLAERTRGSYSPSKPSKVAKISPKIPRIHDDDEMILQPDEDAINQLRIAAGDVDVSQAQERTHISDSDSGDEREVLKPGSNFAIWEDQAHAGTITRPVARGSSDPDNVKYKIGLEL